MAWVSRAALMAGAALLAACGAGATYPTFGDADYRIEGTTSDPNGGAPVQLVIYRDGPKMRVETQSPQGPVIVVFDEATNAAYVIDAAARTAVLAPATNTPEPMEGPWASLGAENAERVGACEAGGRAGHEWRAKDEPQGRIACLSDDGIVLKIREGERVLFEATRVDAGQQEASLFGIPAGYQVIDPNAALAQVGETMEQLDSVAPEGQAATPQAQPPAQTQQRTTTTTTQTPPPAAPRS